MSNLAAFTEDVKTLRLVFRYLSCICVPSEALEKKSQHKCGRATTLPAPPPKWSLFTRYRTMPFPRMCVHAAIASKCSSLCRLILPSKYFLYLQLLWPQNAGKHISEDLHYKRFRGRMQPRTSYRGLPSTVRISNPFL